MPEYISNIFVFLVLEGDPGPQQMGFAVVAVECYEHLHVRCASNKCYDEARVLDPERIRYFPWRIQ